MTQKTAGRVVVMLCAMAVPSVAGQTVDPGKPAFEVATVREMRST
jgi:hypothetical protein